MRLRSLALLAGWLLTPLGLLAATSIVRGPYLQSANPTSVVVRWRTDLAEKSVVNFGLQRTGLKKIATAEGITTEHIVALTGLTPNTRYYYTVGTGLTKTANDEDAPPKNPVNSFVTPPPVGPARPVRFWVLGDPGTKDQVQRRVRDAYLKFAGNRGADLWLLLGDNAYPEGSDTDYQRAIFDMYPDLLSTAPVWPTLGNHDGKSANSLTQSGVYFDIFTLPTRGQCGGVASGTEAYYSFDYANIHFVCLDSHDTERTPDGAMAQWLQADLAATTRDWIVAFFHHPPYTKGNHDSDLDSDSGGRMRDMRTVLLPLLEAGGTDLILNGHSHTYERTPLINGHYGKSPTFDPKVHVKQAGNGRADGDGVYRKPRRRTANAGEIAVVTGSAGHAVTGNKPPPLNHPAMIVNFNEPGSSIVDVDGLRLELVFLNDQGVQRDRFTIVKE